MFPGHPRCGGDPPHRVGWCSVFRRDQLCDEAPPAHGTACAAGGVGAALVAARGWIRQRRMTTGGLGRIPYPATAPILAFGWIWNTGRHKACPYNTSHHPCRPGHRYCRRSNSVPPQHRKPTATGAWRGVPRIPTAPQHRTPITTATGCTTAPCGSVDTHLVMGGRAGIGTAFPWGCRGGPGGRPWGAFRGCKPWVDNHCRWAERSTPFSRPRLRDDYNATAFVSALQETQRRSRGQPMRHAPSHALGGRAARAGPQRRQR